MLYSLMLSNEKGGVEINQAPDMAEHGDNYD
jgi:hypothetical protein